MCRVCSSFFAYIYCCYKAVSVILFLLFWKSWYNRVRTSQDTLSWIGDNFLTMSCWQCMLKLPVCFNICNPSHEVEKKVKSRSFELMINQLSHSVSCNMAYFPRFLYFRCYFIRLKACEIKSENIRSLENIRHIAPGTMQ